MNCNWTNTRGNGCELNSYESRSSEYYKYKFQNTNWYPLDNIKYDSDTHVWINPNQLKIIIFKMGEEILIVCNNSESFRDELANLRKINRIH